MKKVKSLWVTIYRSSGNPVIVFDQPIDLDTHVFIEDDGAVAVNVFLSDLKYIVESTPDWVVN